jgi:hypothetical protein
VPTIDHNTGKSHSGHAGSLGIEASSGTPSRKDFETMARRRFQDPKPKREGNHWYLRVWQDTFVGGVSTRKRQRIKIAPASMLEREAKKIAAETLRPVNQGLVTVGSAVNFTEYVDATYIPTVLPLLAKTTQESYRVRIRKYLKPSFGASCLRDLSPLTLQRYFLAMTSEGIAYPSILKIHDTLSSILRSAVQYNFLVKNPLDGLRLPPDKRGRRSKPFISPNGIFGATGQHQSRPPVQPRSGSPEVIARIHRLRALTVNVKAGNAVRHYKLVKSSNPDDLVFQSVKEGKPMRITIS